MNELHNLARVVPWLAALGLAVVLLSTVLDRIKREVVVA